MLRAGFRAWFRNKKAQAGDGSEAERTIAGRQSMSDSRCPTNKEDTNIDGCEKVSTPQGGHEYRRVRESEHPRNTVRDGRRDVSRPERIQGRSVAAASGNGTTNPSWRVKKQERGAPPGLPAGRQASGFAVEATVLKPAPQSFKTLSPPRGSGGVLIEALQKSFSDSIQSAIQRTTAYLLDRQHLLGYWVGELEADTSLESDTIKRFHLLDQVDVDRERRLVQTILKNQLPEGGWPIYFGGPPELNATVKAYVALRLAGFSSHELVLGRAREVILKLGGLERVNSFEKIYLALFGCYPWSEVPAIPPELILLPNWFPFNIYEVAYWSRTILVPLTAIRATRPTLKEGLTLEELWINPERKRAKINNHQKEGAVWRFFFLGADHLLKLHEASPWKPFRAKALRAVDDWICQRIISTDGLGAIFPAMLNAVFALKCLGHSDGDPFFERSVKELERLEFPDGEHRLKVQPCFSPVWDTGLCLYILGKTRLPETSLALSRGAEWLKDQEIRIRGDWAVKNPKGKAGGWAFEFQNPYYPDVDDTAQVLLGIEAVYGSEAIHSMGHFKRGLDWILSMQNRDGGWGSYDKDSTCMPLDFFPFADHNAMLDPSANDITGRILELLAKAGLSRTHPAMRQGIQFLRDHQESDGSWFGRWGVNYIYGTWLALRGLKAAGEPMESIRYSQTGRWLVKHQNSDGGWGESCHSYDDLAKKGQGPSTASQTAWALMALMSLGMVAGAHFKRGVEYLLTRQEADGNWSEQFFTGTGFPKVFYLKYHLYRTYFPLLALAEAKELFKETG